MKLPKEVRNSQSGQILVIFLLVLVVGLALVLSIASRTVTDVRQSTTSDESNRAYFAAESGVQNALKKITETPGFSTDVTPGAADVNFNGVNSSSAGVTVTSISVSSSQIFEYPAPVAKDDVSQVSLISNFNDEMTITGISPSFAYNEGLNIYFGTAVPVALSDRPSVEVSLITKDGSTPPVWGIRKYTFNGETSNNAINHFCTATQGTYNGFTNQDGASAKTYVYRAQVRFAVGNTDCPPIPGPPTGSTPNDNNPSGARPVLVRIRLLYNPSPIALAVQGINAAGTGTRDLPSQGSKITSLGKTPSGVTRKLTATRLYPALPAIFDYVLFNGSSNPLTK